MKVINLKFKTLVNCKLILNKKSLYQDKVKKKKKKSLIYIYLFVCFCVVGKIDMIVNCN